MKSHAILLQMVARQPCIQLQVKIWYKKPPATNTFAWTEVQAGREHAKMPMRKMSIENIWVFHTFSTYLDLSHTASLYHCQLGGVRIQRRVLIVALVLWSTAHLIIATAFARYSGTRTLNFEHPGSDGSAPFWHVANVSWHFPEDRWSLQPLPNATTSWPHAMMECRSSSRSPHQPWCTFRCVRHSQSCCFHGRYCGHDQCLLMAFLLFSRSAGLQQEHQYGYALLLWTTHQRQLHYSKIWKLQQAFWLQEWFPLAFWHPFSCPNLWKDNPKWCDESNCSNAPTLQWR